MTQDRFRCRQCRRTIASRRRGRVRPVGQGRIIVVKVDRVQIECPECATRLWVTVPKPVVC